MSFSLLSCVLLAITQLLVVQYLVFASPFPQLFICEPGSPLSPLKWDFISLTIPSCFQNNGAAIALRNSGTPLQVHIFVKWCGVASLDPAHGMSSGGAKAYSRQI